ncbi:MAG: MATE family efflux transporter [Scytonematopsis contorta HA4267-MV1]|jgi:putative MATE family efflux protein|nr:MATE family efflux transporter [Scytonematopsis contorta HA4267-MV1]
MTSQEQSQVTNEILQGSLLKLMFKLSIPSILGILMLSLNSFIDALFAGQLIGENALAGISLALPLIGVVNGFTLVIAVGSASILSRAIGSGDVKTQSKIFGNLTIVVIIVSFIITIIGYKFSKQLILFMGGSGEVSSAGTEYFQVYILGSVFSMLSGAYSQLIRAEGKARLDMIFSWIFVFVNIVLNYIFTKFLHWGVRGIAFATIIAMFIHAVVSFIYFICGKATIPVNYKKLVLEMSLLPNILLVGISELLYPLMELVQSFVVYKSISSYGIGKDIALFGATSQLNSFVYIPLLGFSQALQPIIGMNYGYGNYGRLKRAYLTFAIIATILFILVLLPLQISPKIFLNLLLPNVNFTNNDLLNFRIFTALTPLWPVAIFGNTLFQFIGKGQVVVFVILLRSILLYIPMVLLLSRYFGVTGIYYGIFIADVLFIVFTFILIFMELKYFNVRHTKKLNQ